MCVLVPARPPKKLKRRQTSPNGLRLPPVVLRGCFAAKKRVGYVYIEESFDTIFNIGYGA